MLATAEKFPMNARLLTCETTLNSTDFVLKYLVVQNHWNVWIGVDRAEAFVGLQNDAAHMIVG